jgi:hypothetical protein
MAFLEAAPSPHLLVVDNVDDPILLARLLGRAERTRVLAISLSPNRDALGVVTRELMPLDREASAHFLLTRALRGDRPGAFRLADALGSLPLALEQAGAYLEAVPGLSFDEYVSALEHDARRTFEKGTPRWYEERVSTAWNLSLQRAQREVNGARRFIQLCRYYAPDRIPISLILPNGDPTRPSELPDRIAVR